MEGDESGGGEDGLSISFLYQQISGKDFMESSVNSQRRRYLDSLCQAHLCLGSPVSLGVASARNIRNAIIVECMNTPGKAPASDRDLSQNIWSAAMADKKTRNI